MNIYISHSREFDFKEELYSPIKKLEVYNQHNFILPHDSSESAFLTKESLKSDEIDLIIAEVSFPSTGQGIELGWASLFDIPISCIYKGDHNFTSALKSISEIFIEYEKNGLSELIFNIVRENGNL